MDRVKLFLKNNFLTVIGAIIGGIGGYFYWLKVGCVSGTCPITSSPIMSSIWGMLVGGLFFSMFHFKSNKNETENKDNQDINEI